MTINTLTGFINYCSEGVSRVKDLTAEDAKVFRKVRKELIFNVYSLRSLRCHFIFAVNIRLVVNVRINLKETWVIPLKIKKVTPFGSHFPFY